MELRRINYYRAAAVELAADEGNEGPSAIASAIGSTSPSADPAEVADRVRAMLTITLEQQRAWKTEYDAIKADLLALDGDQDRLVELLMDLPSAMPPRQL